MPSLNVKLIYPVYRGSQKQKKFDSDSNSYLPFQC